MSEPLEEPILYRVSYSKRVREELKRLVVRARNRGMASEVIEAIKEIDRRLKLYPQFGQPLRDLSIPYCQIWIGAIPPLVIEYLLDEEGRQVIFGYPLRTLPNSGM